MPIISKKIEKSSFVNGQNVPQTGGNSGDHIISELPSLPMVFDVSRGTWIVPEQGRSRCFLIENEEKANV
jgi:hypothetical protein